MANEENELPPLPAFLDRKRWTAEQWSKSEHRQQEVRAQIEQELNAIACRAQQAKEAKKVKEAEDAQKTQERQAQAAEREARRVMRSATLAYVRRALDAGPQTANGLRQNASEHQKSLVPWALRTMLKKGEVKKASRQTYERVR